MSEVYLQTLDKAIHAVGVAQSALLGNSAPDDCVSIADQVVSPVTVTTVSPVELDSLETIRSKGKNRVLFCRGHSR